jgi:hypothetical protein
MFGDGDQLLVETLPVGLLEQGGSGVGFSDGQSADPDRFRPPR